MLIQDFIFEVFHSSYTSGFKFKFNWLGSAVQNQEGADECAQHTIFFSIKRKNSLLYARHPALCLKCMPCRTCIILLLVANLAHPCRTGWGCLELYHSFLHEESKQDFKSLVYAILLLDFVRNNQYLWDNLGATSWGQKEENTLLEGQLHLNIIQK